MDKQLLLFNSDGSEFVVDGEKLLINDFKYSAKRMGTAPTITATINHPKCLDDLIDNTKYTVFNDEKYFLKGAIASSYDSSSITYKHETTWVSERAVLETVYFFDTVKDQNAEYDAPVSNSSTFSFFGDIRQFAERFNTSLSWSGLRGDNGYEVIVDESVNSNSVELQFDKVYLYKALQEANSKFEIPFYFRGKEIHFGDADSVEFSSPLEYGAENSLVSIKKVVKTSNTYNRITGVGSERNISYFYPNPTPKGTLAVNSNVSESAFTITNMLKFSRTMPLAPSKAQPSDETLYAQYKTEKVILPEYYSLDDDIDAGIWRPTIWPMVIQGDTRIKLKTMVVQRVTGGIKLEIETKCKNNIEIDYSIYSDGVLTSYSGGDNYILPYNAVSNDKFLEKLDGVEAGTYSFEVEILVSPTYETAMPIIETKITQTPYNYWMIEGDPKEYDLEDFGLSTYLNSFNNAIFWQYSKKRVNVQNRLMPTRYRESDGAERFYENPEGGVDPIQRRELIIEEDIYPSITNTKNAALQYIDSFIDFAYDVNDNDEIYPVGHEKEGQYVHPYFYAKLKRFNGDNGFNLFDHAIENNPMTISFTNGKCGGCNFTIGVGETGKNEVQVTVESKTNDDGIGEIELVLKRDSSGNVIATGAPIPQQNNTLDNEVWIALKKEDQTFGTLMPHAAPAFRPSPEDKFVILNIDLPLKYITEAEKKLTAAIKAKLDDSAEYKFGYSVKLSRVFFEENVDYAEKISENVRIPVKYNNKEESYYVTSYNYTMKSDSPLPEVSLELDNSIETKKSAIALLQEDNNSTRNALLSDLTLTNDKLQGGLSALTTRTNDVAILAAEAAKSSENNTSLIYGSVVPNWQILYTTANDKKLEFGADIGYIQSHTFENGIGIITISPNINAEIPAGMFSGQEYLSKVSLPSNIKNIGNGAFSGCKLLLEVNFGSGLKTISNRAFFRCERLLTVNIPDSVESIGEYAFSRCTNLTNLQLGKGLKEIGPRAFYECKKIKFLTIPENVNSIGYDAWGYEPGINVGDSNLRGVICSPIIPPKISFQSVSATKASIFGVKYPGSFSIAAPSNYKDDVPGWKEYKDFINSDIKNLTIPHILAYQTALNASGGSSANVDIALKDDDYPNTAGFLGVDQNDSNIDGSRTLYVGANVCREYSEGDSLATVKSVEDVVKGYADRDSLRESTEEHNFTWRVATGNSRDTDSLAVVNKIIGNTIRWNQLINGKTTNNTDKTAFVDQEGNVTVSYNNGEITITNNTIKSENYLNVNTFGALSDVELTSGNRYLICADRAHSGIGITEGPAAYTFHHVNSVFTAVGGAVPLFAINHEYIFKDEHSYVTKNGVTTINQPTVSMKLNLFDLTEMFGKDNEPQSLGEFRKLYPKAYYEPCTTPQTVGVKIEALPAASYNLWNVNEAVRGAIMWYTGWLRSDAWYKNWWTYIIPVAPNTKYYLLNVANRSQCMPCVFYGEDMTQLRDTNGNVAEGISHAGPQNLDAKTESVSGEVLTPADAAYMAVMVHNTYKGKACVSVSSRRNGDYEAYIASGAPLTLEDADGNELFPHGLLATADGVADEVGEGYALQRVAYNTAADGTISNLRQVEIVNSAGNTVKGFYYYPINTRLWMTWRVRRGATEKVTLNNESAPFRASISYALDVNDLLPAPILEDVGGGTILTYNELTRAPYRSKHTIAQFWGAIMSAEEYMIPTCLHVRQAMNYLMPAAAAPATPRQTITSPTAITLVANTIVEYPREASVMDYTINKIVPNATDINTYDDLWVLRGPIGPGGHILFSTAYSIKWKDNKAPSFSASGRFELRLRRWGDSSSNVYLGEWSYYPA